MLVVVFFFGFSWAIWYVSYARLKDKLSLLRGERAEELSQLDQKIKQLESSHWSTDTDLRREVAQLTRHVQELQFKVPITEEERLSFERERTAKETGCDPADVILAWKDFRRRHYEPLRQNSPEELPSGQAASPDQESEPMA